MSLTIGIDFDSTLVKIDQPWLDRLNRQAGTHYRTSQWRDWELSFLSDVERGLFFRLFTPDIYETAKPYPYVQEAIRQLHRLPGVTLKVVTATPSHQIESFVQAKHEWLERHIPELAGTMVSTQFKGNLGLDILVDDAPQHLRNTSSVPVLVRRPWNQGETFKYQFAEWRRGQRLLMEMVEGWASIAAIEQE